MPYTEYLKWLTYFRKRPVGWREDRRTFMLLKAQGVKSDEGSLFPTLKMIKAAAEESQVPDQAVPKGRIFDLMTRAKNGDDVPWI